MRLKKLISATCQEWLVYRILLQTMAAPKSLKVSEWADTERKLPPEAAEPGRWYTERAEYQREILDAFSDPKIEKVVVMTSSQVGKTEILLNVIGYHIDHDPCTILFVTSTIELAKAVSKDRVDGLIDHTPCLKGTVKEARERDSGNTILHKQFCGGQLTLGGSNSPSSLTSRPIRIVLCDEVDKYKASAGEFGDPVDLAFKRSTTYWNRKLGMLSTPGIKGLSRIEKAYEESDMRKYYVPCPHCGEYQTLKKSQLRWPEQRPKEAIYHCEICDSAITDRDKIRMVRLGEWRAHQDVSGVAGFWLNELYSPWVSFGDFAQKFVDAKRRGTESLKQFINESLAETWEEAGSSPKEDSLYARREDYGPEIPLEAAVLTCGVDVQDNRIETEVIAWGKGEESWGIEFKIFQGDPARQMVWNDLNAYLQTIFPHASGVSLRIAAACIDTGGHHTQQVYNFVRPREIKHIYGIKGANRPGEPIWPKRASRKNTGRINLYTIGTDGAKDLIYNRLRIEEPGPGYMHFPLQYDEEYFRQLTAEKVIHEKGMRKWVLKKGMRNEALDIRVYAIAALERLKQSKWFVRDVEKLVDRYVAMGVKEQDITEIEQIEANPGQITPEHDAIPQRKWVNPGVRRGGGWINWRK